jgi:tRNA pseudouridine55 synthase
VSWDGLLLINKPAGVTSHTVVQGMKNRLKVAKAGHLGTLDPLATGVFPVCLGKATRLSHFYMKADKAYLAAVRFGFFTSTDDREGEQEGPRRKARFTLEQLRKAVDSFQGDYDQKPPLYSAKKIRGQAAHRLARRGIKPVLPVQKVHIHEISLVHFDSDIATIYIHCSSGTYVRSIARELGIRLRCGAHVQDLSRTRFGAFALDQTCDPEAPDSVIVRSFIPVEQMLPQFPEIVIDENLGKKLTSGSVIQVQEPIEQEWVRVFNERKSLLALAQVETGESASEAARTPDRMRKLQPKIVFL